VGGTSTLIRLIVNSYFGFGSWTKHIAAAHLHLALPIRLAGRPWPWKGAYNPKFIRPITIFNAYIVYDIIAKVPFNTGFHTAMVI